MKAVTLVKKWNGLLSTAQARAFPHWGTTGHFFISLLYQQQCLDKLSFVMLLNKIHLRKGLSLILSSILVISLLKWFQLSSHQPSFGSQVIPVWSFNHLILSLVSDASHLSIESGTGLSSLIVWWGLSEMGRWLLSSSCMYWDWFYQQDYVVLSLVSNFKKMLLHEPICPPSSEVCVPKSGLASGPWMSLRSCFGLCLVYCPVVADLKFLVFLTRGSSFSLCPGPYRLSSWFCF